MSYYATCKLFSLYQPLLILQCQRKFCLTVRATFKLTFFLVCSIIYIHIIMVVFEGQFTSMCIKKEKKNELIIVKDFDENRLKTNEDLKKSKIYSQ